MPMDFLDIRTVVFSQLLIQLVCAFVIFLLWRDNRARYDGLGLWVLNSILQPVALAFVLLRGQIPDFLSMVVGNTLALGAVTLLYSGLARFAGRPALDRLNLYALGVFALVHTYFSVVDVSFYSRNLNFNAFFIFYSLRIVLLMRRYPPELKKHAAAVSHPFMAFASISLVRILLVISGEHPHDFMQNLPSDTALFLLYSGLLIVLTYGLFLIVNRRLLADTKADYEGRIEAEKVLSGALRVAKLGTWRWDIKTNRLNWSDEMYSIFGIDKAGFTGSLVDVLASAIHPDDKAAVEAANVKVMNEGLPEGLSYRVNWPDGSLHWVYAEASELLKDEAGAPAVLKGYAQDITALKLAEEKLRDTAVRLELAQVSAGMGSWYWDIKADRRNFDGQVCRLFGLDKDKFCGSAEEFFSIVHPEDRAAVKAALERTISTDEPYAVEYRAVWPDGSVHYVAVRGRLRRDETGGAWRIDGLLWDITERKISEAELKASEERFQKAFHAAPFLMSLSEIETGRYIEVNDKFCEVTGFSREELVGKTSTEIGWISQAARSKLVRESNGTSLRIPELTLTAKGGRPVVCSYACERVRLGGKNILLAIAEDITSLKQAETSIRVAQKLEALGTLAGGIAHDFNNLLTGITGNLSLMRNTASSGMDIGELVQEAETACFTARGLARQLLTFASGGEPVKAPLDMVGLIRESVSFSLRGSSVRAEVTGEEGLRVLGDKDQLFQVMQNLVINASQAMAGAGVVQVSVEEAELSAEEVQALPAGRYVRVDVRDSGPGIRPETLLRIFDPYFSTKGQGRGLGLAVCRSVVTKHGGQILAASTLGKGSVFSVYLPATSAQPVAVAGPMPAPAAAGGRVLVMDDEEVVYKALRRMLTSLGYEAEVVTDGTKALEAWAAAKQSDRPFSAAIMDLTIPGGMGGAEAVKLLKVKDPKAKVLVSSGYSEGPVMAEYSDCGFDGVLAKPYRVEDLAAALSKLLS